MKKTTLLIVTLILLLVTSCSDSKISIEGEIGNKYNGETIYLYVIEPNTFKDFKLLATATVSNGTFHFDDLDASSDLFEKDLPSIGYVSLFDMDMTEEELTEENAESPMAMVILEKGNGKVVFAENSVEVSGTQRNTEFNKMHLAIKNLVEFTSQFSTYDELDTLPVNAEGKDGRAQLQELDKKLRDQSYSFIKDNITNNVGEYLFLRSGDGMFTPSQTLGLIDMASSDFKARPDVAKMKSDMTGSTLEIPQIENKTEDLE